MSKSGLFAHFRSKEDRQVATIDAAAEMFHREVTQPGLAAPAGVRRVRPLREAFLGTSSAPSFPAAASSWPPPRNLTPSGVPSHDLRGHSRILEGLAGIIREAQDVGEIAATEDVAQLTFEVDSLTLGANFAYVFFGFSAALDRARLAIDQRLARAALAISVRGPRASASGRTRSTRTTRSRQRA